MRTMSRMKRSNGTAERGAAAIIVALSLLVLLGFTALAIDAGLGYSERRGTQNAADNAALAAAWEDCNPADAATPSPLQSARSTAADNGYDHADPNVTVDVTEVAAGQWQVNITDVNAATFGNATPYADDEITVLSSSVAECIEKKFLGGYALFAGGPPSCNGGVELDLSGSSKIVNGGIHSNGDVKITGASTTINGTVSHLGSSNYTPSTQVYASIDYPIDLVISDYRPGGARAASWDDPVTPFGPLDFYFNSSGDMDNGWLRTRGLATGNNAHITMTRSGVYYSSGGIDLKGVTMAPGVKATFVAEDQIKVVGQSDFAGFDPIVGGANDPGVLFFSNLGAPGATCTGSAVNVSTSSVTWTGLIFAPYGAVTPSFSSAASLNGSIFAYTINVSGSNFDITWKDNPNGIPDFEVNLLK